MCVPVYTTLMGYAGKNVFKCAVFNCNPENLKTPLYPKPLKTPPYPKALTISEKNILLHFEARAWPYTAF